MRFRRELLAATVPALLLPGCTGLSAEVPSVEEQSCPPGGFVSHPASCSHAEDVRHGVEVDVTPQTIEEQASFEEFTVTLVNRGDGQMTLDPGGWHIWHRRGRDWARISADKPAGNDRTDSTITIRSNQPVKWEGLDSTFDGFDSDIQSGLYAAVVPVERNGSTFEAVAVFRIVLD